MTVNSTYRLHTFTYIYIYMHIDTFTYISLSTLQQLYESGNMLLASFIDTKLRLGEINNLNKII